MKKERLKTYRTQSDKPKVIFQYLIIEIYNIDNIFLIVRHGQQKFLFFFFIILQHYF